jgi:hypothetical protein
LLVKITEQNLTKATHDPRQDNACGSRFRPYVHVHVHVTRNLETQTDRHTPAGAPSCIQRVQVYLREAGTHTHTRTSNDIHTTRQLVVHSIRAATYIHAHNEQSEPVVLPPCRVFRTKQAQRSTIPGCRNDERENLPLECLVEPATTALVSSFFFLCDLPL